MQQKNNKFELNNEVATFYISKKNLLVYFHIPICFLSVYETFEKFKKHSSQIPSFHNSFLTALFESNVFRFKWFWSERNKWYSDGARSGLYGGWGNTSQPNSNYFLRVTEDVFYIYMLSWWKKTLLRVANSGRCNTLLLFCINIRWNICFCLTCVLDTGNQMKIQALVNQWLKYIFI